MTDSHLEPFLKQRTSKVCTPVLSRHRESPTPRLQVIPPYALSHPGFIAHIYDRDLEAQIAELEVGEGHPMGRVVDILLGGGLCFFLPNTTTGSCREDTKDVLKIARQNGYNAFTDRAGFDALKNGTNATQPYLGVFTSGHMSYEVDRNNSREPSLAEMSYTALNTLKTWQQKNDKGFFIMIEAARYKFS